MVAKLDLETEATEESVGYQPKGYQFLGEFAIQCLGCDKPCVRVTIADKGPKYPDQTIQVMCNKCGMLSFKKYIGQVKAYVEGIDNFRISDTQFLDNLLLIEVK